MCSPVRGLCVCAFIWELVVVIYEGRAAQFILLIARNAFDLGVTSLSIFWSRNLWKPDRRPTIKVDADCCRCTESRMVS